MIYDCQVCQTFSLNDNSSCEEMALLDVGLLTVYLLGTLTIKQTDCLDVFWTIPPSAQGIKGENVTITWLADLSSFSPPNGQWTFVTVYQKQLNGADDQVIKLSKSGTTTIYPGFRSRFSDFNVNASQNGREVTIIFQISNLNATTDARLYTMQIGQPENSEKSTKYTNLTIEVPIIITTPHPRNVTINEGQQASLICESTGKPTPNINWTRNDVIVHTGSPYDTSMLTYNDNVVCYTCVAYNGVARTKTAQYCLDIQYKPRNATLTVDRSTVCQNETVTLTCTSGPSNPAPSTYKFYYNKKLVQNSWNNVYIAIATLPSRNRFTCVPNNRVGDALTNASVVVTTKAEHFTSSSTANSEVTTDQSSLTTQQTLIITSYNAARSKVPSIVLGVLFAVSLSFNVILVGYIVWRHIKENKARSDNSLQSGNETVFMNNIAIQDQGYSSVHDVSLQHESNLPAVYQSIQNNSGASQPQESTRVTQNKLPATSQEQHQPIAPVYQSVQVHTDTYSSLSPSTKLPPKPAVLTNSGHYENLQSNYSRYQSLDEISRI